MSIYKPREDSYLLEAAVIKYAFGGVLDVGTGSGIQAAAAIKNKKVTKVLAADLNKNCEKNIKRISNRIKFIRSDLFKKIPKQKFDSIIFNPPYLPQDKGIIDKTIYGGKNGYEVIERFLNSCNDYLAKRGIILLLFSNRSKKEKIHEIIENNCLEKEEISIKELPFFEKLYVYKIKKSRLLRKLEQLHVTNVKKFAMGHRGIIYTGFLRNKKVAIKVKRPDSFAIGAIANESKWLKILNKHGIGPILLRSYKDHFIYLFVEGTFILDFIKQCNNKKIIIAVIKNILQQCRTMDKLKVNKEEMLRPHKHALVGSSNKVVLLDFERCRFTLKPKNVTQFCQFLVNGYFQELLKTKHISINRKNLLDSAKDYKREQDDRRYKNVVNNII